MAAKSKTAANDSIVEVEEVQNGSDAQGAQNLQSDSNDQSSVSDINDTDAAQPETSDESVESTAYDSTDSQADSGTAAEEESIAPVEPAAEAKEDKSTNMEETNQERQQETAQNPSDFFGEPQEKQNGGFPKGILAVIVLLLVGAGVVGYMFLRPQTDGESLGIETESAVENQIAPAIQEEEEVDLAGLSVQILNGSGTAGEAGEVKALLTDAGFDEELLTTGNAKSQTSTVTTVSVKPGVAKGALDAVISALEESFEVEEGDELGETSEFDIVVTTGGALEADDEASESADEE